MTTLPQLTNIEYRSKEEVNGWPLIHINLGTNPETGQPRVAKGFVAIGNIAFGIVSIGAAAFGIVTLAAFGLGIVSLGAFAVGIIALGAVAFGYEYALGAVVESAKVALGVTGLNSQVAVWSLIFAACVGVVIWMLSKFISDRLQK